MVSSVVWLFATFAEKKDVEVLHQRISRVTTAVHQLETDLAVIKDRLHIPHRPVAVLESRSTVITNTP